MKNTKSTPSKKTTTRKPKALKTGTVAWLIEELKKCPGDLPVMQGTPDQQFYLLSGLAVQHVELEDGYRVEDDDEDGVKCVALMTW